MPANGHSPEPVFLLFGKSGWIGGLLGQLLKEQGAKFDFASARLEDRSSIIAEIDRVGTFPSCNRPKAVAPTSDTDALQFAGEADSCAERRWSDWSSQRRLVRISQGECSQCCQVPGQLVPTLCGDCT